MKREIAVPERMVDPGLEKDKVGMISIDGRRCRHEAARRQRYIGWRGESDSLSPSPRDHH